MLVKFDENCVEAAYAVAKDYGDEYGLEIIVNYDDEHGDSWAVLKDFKDGYVEADRFCPSDYVLNDIWARMFDGPCVYAGTSIRQAYARLLIERAAISKEGDRYNPYIRRTLTCNRLI
jgi:hypothetical protein